MSETNGNGVSRPFTPTEQRLLAVLADGDLHRKEQLILAIDEQADANSLRVHMTRMRKKLRDRNEMINCVCLPRGQYAYVHVRRLMPVE